MSLARRWWIIGVCIPILLLSVGRTTYGDSLLALIKTEPSVVPVGVRTPVLVSVAIQDPPLNLARVFLREIDSRNRVKNLGTLKDNGKRGDEVAGDRIFSRRLNIKRKSSGPIRLQVAVKLRKVREPLLSDVVVLDVVSVPSGFEPPSDHVEETVTGETESVTFTSARYVGTVQLPSAAALASLEAGALQVEAGMPGRSSPVFPGGFFTLRLNTESTAAIRLKDQTGQLWLLGVFPKHPNLKNTNPVLNPFRACCRIWY